MLCQTNPAAPSPTVVAEGASCPAGSACPAGSFCSAPYRLCAKVPGLGQDCSQTLSCVGESFCSGHTFKCEALPAVGADCGFDGQVGHLGYCAAGATCQLTSDSAGTCVKVPAIGEACITYNSATTRIDGSCVAGAHCNWAVSPPVCAAPGAPGAYCAVPADCQNGLFCLCPDGTLDCKTSNICVNLRLGKQTCGAVGEVCHPGFSCTNGACAPRDLRGTFASCLAAAP